jgi:uncharacterized protein YbdZ (MbtH family)
MPGVADARAGSCAMSKVPTRGRTCEAPGTGGSSEYIEKTWTDMRPKSLIEAQGG